MNIRLMSLSDLHTAKVNVRKHSDKQIEEYIRSIESFEQVKPIVIDDTGEIICGNGLFLALQRMGRTECYCHVIEGITPNQKKKLMLADNRIYELGKTDMDAFEEIIRELENDLEIPGWDEDLLKTLKSSMAEANAMIESYGIYDPDEVRVVANRQREDHTTYIPPNMPNQRLQQVSDSMQHAEPIEDRLAAQPSAAPVETARARTIVCPHCGQTITLTQDMLGGV